MLTVLEIVRRSEAFLRDRGVPNPRLDAELLVAGGLGIRRLDLYLQFDRPLEAARLDPVRAMIKRRAAREPLQYILGRVDFCGLQLAADSRALVPRPETEELVEAVEARLERAPAAVLDLGTGGGAIALALAARFPDAAVTAVDVSADALALAGENAAALGLDGRVRLLRGDWWEAVPERETFDAIVSNPPYLTDAELASAEPEVAEHEPEQALVAGGDGLDAIRLIVAGAAGRLAPGGLLALETGIHHQDTIQALAEDAGLSDVERLADLSGRPRFVLARRV